MNEYDTNRIYDTVKNIGYFKTDNQLDADCYLLNTCHIRDKSKEKVFDEIGRVRKNYNNKKKPIIVIAGCVAQAESNEMIKREPYIDIIIGPQSYHKINKIIKNFNLKKKQEETEFDTENKFNYLDKIKNSNSNVSSYLTIQEGCDKFCSFCVVPYTRGPEYSRPHNQIIEEAKNLAEQGVKEIVLLGQNVNAYNDSSYKLSDLILKLEELKQIERIRYTTSHPRDMSNDLIELYKTSKKIMPLVHLPIQSGSDKILKIMNRGHTVKDYLKIYYKLKEINPSIQFSSDFIIAYPGEDEKDFNNTLSLIKEIEFINSYSFIFSPRPGTVAENLTQLDKKISLSRLEKVQKYLSNIQKDKNKSFEKQTIKVLIENETKDKSKLFGRSEYMNSVLVTGSKEFIGKIVEVKIYDSNQHSLIGKIEQISNQKVA